MLTGQMLMQVADVWRLRDLQHVLSGLSPHQPTPRCMEHIAYLDDACRQRSSGHYLNAWRPPCFRRWPRQQHAGSHEPRMLPRRCLNLHCRTNVLLTR